MAYNRWLEHHGVKGQHWGERNGPPYPLDSSKSDGNKLLTKGSGSPQDKKRYKTSEKTAHKRAERKARTTRDDTSKRTDKEAKLKAAKDNDEFDLDYLEAIQNEPWFYQKYDEKRVMKEYSKYLDDPEGYYKLSSSDSAGDDRKYDEALRAPLDTLADRKDIKGLIRNFLGKPLYPKPKSPAALEPDVDFLNAKYSKKHDPHRSEPATVEKIKTKRGETYEINDWDGDAPDTVKAFKNNSESHINIARKAALSEARQILGWYAKGANASEVKRIQSMSDDELSKRFGLALVTAHRQGTVVLEFTDKGTGDFVGHVVSVEYDVNQRKVRNVSVNG